MSETMPERPAAGRRRPKPAADVNVDPIESVVARPLVSAAHSTSTMQTSTDGSSSGQLSKKVLRAPFSTRLDEETIYILNRVKLEEGIKIYEAIESAVKQQWGTYGRKK